MIPHPPIGLFAAVMGLIGLGLAARAAAPLFPGVFRAPAYFTEPWIAAGLLLYVFLVALYARKALRDTKAVKSELHEPRKLGFAGAPAVATSLASAGLAPYAPQLADLLWWIALVLTLALLAWGVVRISQLGFDTRELHPGWIVVMMGGIVLPAGGIALGHAEIAQGVFALAAVAGLLIAVPLAIAAPLPPRLWPTWFILLAPPALLYLHGAALFRKPFFDVFFYAAVATAIVLLGYAALRLRGAEFGPAWWSVTFPLDAFALAATRYARDEGGPPSRALAGFALALATLAVLFMVLKTVAGLARRKADAPSRPA